MTVIGCPSMYTYGDSLTQRPLTLDRDIVVSVNYSKLTDKTIIEFLNNIAAGYPNSQFVAQRTPELRMLYTGYEWTYLERKDDVFPNILSHFLYQSNKVKCFPSPASWINDMKNVDLSIGTRLHGNIAAILGGAPVVNLALDARTQELAAYHRFPTIPVSEVNTEDTLAELVEKVDMQSHLSVQKKNYDHYIDFLKGNGINVVAATNQLSNRCLTDQDLCSPESVLFCSEEEQIRRLRKYTNCLVEQNREIVRAKNKTIREQNWIIEKQNAKIDKLKDDLRTYKKVNKKQEKQLSRKSVKFAIKTADTFRKKENIYNIINKRGNQIFLSDSLVCSITYDYCLQFPIGTPISFKVPRKLTILYRPLHRSKPFALLL